MSLEQGGLWVAQVLLVWLPHEDDDDVSRRGFRMRQSAASSTVANLFEGHPMVQQHMVRLVTMSATAHFAGS